MSVQQVTTRIAFAAGRDAGNRSMRKAGRTKWNRTDFNAAASEFARLARQAADLSPELRAHMKIVQEYQK